MSNYTKTTNFAAKDSLPSGNAGKIVKGTEIDAEFNNIATASATKADINDATLTGTTTFGSLNDGTITITGWVDEDNMSSNSAVLVPTQQSVKAYVDSTTTAQDLDVTDGSTSIDIDLDSESLGILGGTGVTSTASGTGVTLAIDSTVATLTGSQTLTNKTLTTPTILTSFTIGSATISEAELEILDGATVTTAELNVLDGITSTTAELNILDGVTSTASELNILDGVTSTTAELNILDGVTSSATELNILDGVTSTTAELNILDGVTSTTAELNILDGVTSTTAELNILDGVTSTATELNLLDGVTATTAELNYTDGVTSAIQTQLDSKISGADAALTGNATITTADDTVQLALISTSADANAGPILDLFRNSVSAADNDLTGQVYFSGKNDADEKTYYGQITSQITDVSNGSEDFALELSTLTAGASNSRLLVTPTETVFNEQSADLDFRIESDGNTNAFFLEGSSGNLGIGATTVNRKLEVAGNNNAGAKANYIRITDTDTTATANNQAGGIEFFTNDVTPGIAASMEVLYAGTGGGGEITFNTNASSSGTLTEALRIDESGNVGIGTVAPWETVSIPFNSKLSFGSSAYPLSISRSSSGTLVTTIEDSYDVSNTRIDFKMRAGSANEVLPLSLSSSGNVGIGIAPSVKLEVNGGSDGSVVFSGRSDGGNGNNQRFNLIAFADGGGSGYGGGLKIQTRSSTNVFSNAVTVASSGNVGIGSSSTDGRLKVSAASGASVAGSIALYGNNSGAFGGSNVAKSKIESKTDGTAFGANMLFYTNDTSNAYQERMRISSAGIVTTPYQPAFLANATGQDNIPISANTTVTFGTERFDQGGNFASNTFTAPVTGAYQLNVNIYAQSIDSAADYVQISLKTTLREYYYIFSTTSLDQDAAYMSFPISVLANMDEGDTAHVEVQLNATGAAQMDINSVSSFSGYLAA